jgi:hypothetical protein
LDVDPFYNPQFEDEILLFRPLWLTSFLLDDFLAENRNFGATQGVVLSSASSKTAFCLAFLLKKFSRVKEVVGLTSAANADFVKGLGFYDKVILYSDLASSNAKSLFPGSYVYVDLSGNVKSNGQLYKVLGDDLKMEVRVGTSHWDSTDASKRAKKSFFFFAPAWIVKRNKQIGPDEMNRRSLAAWKLMLANVKNWVKMQQLYGSEETQRVFTEIAQGKAGAMDGFVCSLWTKSKL